MYPSIKIPQQIIRILSANPSDLERETIERVLSNASEFNIDTWRKNEIIEFLKKAKSPHIGSILIDEEDDGRDLEKRGVSEEFFFRKLQEKFLGKVSINSSLIGMLNLEVRPEILYFDSTIKLYIDIEIDEPYEGSTGLPMHNSLVQEAVKDLSYSNARWCVIRFAEQQIHNQTDECITIIDNLINSIQSGRQIEFNNLIPNVKNWTKDESIMMTYQRFRESYIPKQLLHQLKKEVLNDPYQTVAKRINLDNDDLPF